MTNQYDEDLTAPFPVKPFKSGKGTVGRSTIPMWLARYVYSRYARHHGLEPPFEYFLQNGGFDATMLLDLLAGGDGSGQAARQVRATKFGGTSAKTQIPIIKPGTKEYADAMREARGEANPMFFAQGRRR